MLRIGHGVQSDRELLFSLGRTRFQIFHNRQIYGTRLLGFFATTRSESGIMSCARLYCTCTNFDLGVFNTRDWTPVAVSFDNCMYGSRIRMRIIVF